ncbi:hypothetical protein CVCC1112_2806 [Paenarthrobacter nicotinovorans]|nr:hypothetical protein CVCC1112_2806 [Paenarthrobacter nicotinovorans]
MSVLNTAVSLLTVVHSTVIGAACSGCGPAGMHAVVSAAG